VDVVITLSQIVQNRWQVALERSTRQPWSDSYERALAELPDANAYERSLRRRTRTRVRVAAGQA
jgi:hypothetical protein